jgi:hypothetical protein
MENQPVELRATAQAAVAGDAPLAGTLHVHVAFDWGGEVDLDRARRLVPAEWLTLPRRPRTPASIDYRPPPLRFVLTDVALDLPEVGHVAAAAEATVFDFAAVSVALQAPFRLPASGLLRLAGSLSDAKGLVQAARAALEPLHQKLLPAIQQPDWCDLSEEYFVFQVPPAEPLPPPAELLARHGAWLAGLLRLEDAPLSDEEVSEALKLYLRYGPEDLLIADWSAAALIDHDCEETLRAIEFANLQLLEFRHIDGRLDRRLSEAYRLVHPADRSYFPFWKTHYRKLSALGELKIDANDVFERTGNVLKLLGDQYLARVYRILAVRFHLDSWERSIERSLATIQGVYQVVADQAASFRAEFLEWIIIALIAVEIVLGLLKR